MDTECGWRAGRGDRGENRTQSEKRLKTPVVVEVAEWSVTCDRDGTTLHDRGRGGTARTGTAPGTPLPVSGPPSCSTVSGRDVGSPTKTGTRSNPTPSFSPEGLHPVSGPNPSPSSTGTLGFWTTHVRQTGCRPRSVTEIPSSLGPLSGY